MYVRQVKLLVTNTQDFDSVSDMLDFRCAAAFTVSTSRFLTGIETDV